MNWKAEIKTHKGQKRVVVYFDYNSSAIERLKQLEDAKWSKTLNAWHLPATQGNKIRFNLESDSSSIIPKEEAIIQIEEFRKYLKTKRYSLNTIKTYTEALKSFLIFYRDKMVAEIDNKDVINYHQNYILKNNLSSSYQNQIINAIKLYFKTLKNTNIVVDKIYRPKKERLLPNVLSKEEVKLILNAHANIKHKTMLCLIYSCGLRRSELLNLKPKDIDSKRNLVIIRQAKGKKDRIAPLSKAILGLLRNYYKLYSPKEWLFEGQYAGTPYDERSLGNVLKLALKKAKIYKPVTLHWLRHSYATHLLESGTDLRYIQEILGHNSSRTTEIYTHVSTKSLQNVKSPFDDL